MVVQHQNVSFSYVGLATTPIRITHTLTTPPTMIRLSGLFLLCEMKAKREQSFFWHKNSSDVTSSKGRSSFLLEVVLA